MQNFGNHFNTRVTSQRDTIPGRADMVTNAAGGVVFKTSDQVALDRFLILGTEGGTYYATEAKLTKNACTRTLALIQRDGVGVVRRVVEISDAGRAAKNNPALFVLAMCLKLGDVETRRAAAQALPTVARTGTHLFNFCEYLKALGGWGRLTQRAVADWYHQRTTDALAMQLIKYRQRDGWSHKDVLRKAHVRPTSDAQSELFKWVTTNGSAEHSQHRLIDAFMKVQSTTLKAEVLRLITDHKLPREVLPTQWLNDADVWAAMLPHMGYTALIRNLATMTRVGLLKPLSAANAAVIDQLGNVPKGRVHPMQLLVAKMTYGAGRGVRGSNTWTPVPQVTAALEEAFYTSFGLVTPAGKATMVALDVSGSMGWGCDLMGAPGLTPCVASACMAMVTVRSEPNYLVTAFSDTFRVLDITAKDSLNTVIRKVSDLPFNRTDCALPMLAAQQQRWDVDTFAVYTDNETWCGNIHPSQALAQYRQSSGRDARSVVVGMTATKCSIADPQDRGMLDVVGFDTATPQLLSDFSAGKL